MIAYRIGEAMVYLEKFFGWLSRWALEMEMRCAYCPDCGRNRYYGKPCKGEE